VGGAFFMTNAYGAGPNDYYQWNASNRFGDSYAYWTNYIDDDTGSDQILWQPYPFDDNCSNWSSNSSSSMWGVYGMSNSGMDDRWNVGYRTCDNALHLICYVNP